MFACLVSNQKKNVISRQWLDKPMDFNHKILTLSLFTIFTTFLCKNMWRKFELKNEWKHQSKFAALILAHIIEKSV